MHLKIIQAFLSYFMVYVLAYEDIIYVYGQISQQMIEEGRNQYQRLQERGNLPNYGSCWTSAVEHVEEGCRNLSEDAQSDIALHLTNCFLEMLGHETYNCELDKKPNLRKICIMSMSDRAFAVYTEFYTHTLNMCWFLQGQVWHETIAENTWRVGKQLESSARNQEAILKAQQETLDAQEKILQYGQNLESILEELCISVQRHQKNLTFLSKSLGGLQSWIIGEFSWVDLIVFYVSSTLIIAVFTSSTRTSAARLPIFFLLIVNAFIERLIHNTLISDKINQDMNSVHEELHKYTWTIRRLFIALAGSIFLYKVYYYNDLAQLNKVLLEKIYEQNLVITEMLENTQRHKRFSDSYMNENKTFQSPTKVAFNCELSSSSLYNKNEKIKPSINRNMRICNENNLVASHSASCPESKLSFNKLINGRQRIISTLEQQRYNFRRRQVTPDSEI